MERKHTHKYDKKRREGTDTPTVVVLMDNQDGLHGGEV